MSQRKITLIGGGSAKFVRELSVDFFSYPLLQDSHICLMDLNRERVEISERLIKKIIADRKLSATVSSTLDQREAIAGSDYVIITIMVGGLDAYQKDVVIPSRYGVHQTVSDTTGPGGVFRTIRTAPVLQKIAADVLELAPEAWVLNYANPMSMNILSLTRAGLKKVVGLCHSIQHLHQTFGWWLGIPGEEIHYTAGGINHIDFYLTATHKGENLYPRLLAEKDRIIEKNPAEIVRFALLEHLGYFPAEGPHHQSEYYSWFRKDEASIKWTAAETGWGYDVDSRGYKHRFVEIEEQLADRKPISYERSQEYGSRIIHALEGGAPEIFYGNVPNHGLIENLPSDCIAEVPCLVDRNGIVPGRVGTIPTQLAGVMRPHIALHDLAVTGTFEKNRRLIYQAVQADPLTSAVLTLPRIKEMVDDMFAHNKEFVSDWK
jgi:alpha-galactosidase